VDLVKDVDIPTNSLKELIVRNTPFAVAALIGFIFGFKKG